MCIYCNFITIYFVIVIFSNDVPYIHIFVSEMVNKDYYYYYLNNIHTNSIGDDGISIKNIKLCLSFCIDPLIHIINTCILQGEFPDCWKKAIVKPLPKIRNPKEFRDLWPISILPIISKILERHIHNQINSYFRENDLMPESQSGFRKNYSTSTTLICLIDDI